MARRNAKVEEPVEYDEADEADAVDEETEVEEHDLLADLSFEEPPARSRSPRSGKWAKVLNRLRDNPGKWARIAVKDTAGTAAALAGNLRSGTLVGAEKGEFEATSRRLPGDAEQFGVWARYASAEADTEQADEADEYEDYADENE